MTYAQELLEKGRAEGRAEGEARKQIEMIEGFLRVRVTWDVIEAAIGLTEASFQELKTQVAGSSSQDQRRRHGPQGPHPTHQQEAHP